ncbi:hypothetical protein J1614_004222 [Plenodomus biglobosus]|nr:hypothetical protein J1614_004222 [Plenodomus biglobosus]
MPIVSPVSGYPKLEVLACGRDSKRSSLAHMIVIVSTALIRIMAAVKGTIKGMWRLKGWK